MLPGNLFAMFSNFRNFSNNLDTLLDNPEVTLEQVLDEDNLVSALNMQNSKLIEYLNAERISELLEFILILPPEGSDNKRCFRYPFVACEVFCADSSYLTNKIFESELLLEKFFKFLDSDANAIMVGYFSRVFLMFLAKNTKILLYMLTQLGYFPKLVQMVGFRSFCEVIERIIVLDVNIQESFVKQRFDLLKQIVQESRTANTKGKNCSKILSTIISQSIETQTSSLLSDLLSSEDTISQIFSTALTENPSCLPVLKSLLSSSSLQLHIKFPLLISQLSSSFPQLLAILSQPSKTSHNTLQESYSRLGQSKLDSISLISTSLSLKNSELNTELSNSGLIEKTIELLWLHEFNSFLHVQVLNISESILLASSQELVEVLLVKSAFLQGIVDRFQSNPRKKTYNPEVKPGYDGVLIKIANLVEKISNRNEAVKEIVDCKVLGWQEFRVNTVKVRNAIESRELGGYSSSAFDNDDDMPLPDEEDEDENENEDENEKEEQGKEDNEENFHELELSPEVNREEKSWEKVISVDEEYWRF